MYKLIIRPLLFTIDPERVHYIILKTLKFICNISIIGWLLRFLYQKNSPSLEKELFGLKFKNPVGLAAGFDKNGKYIKELANLGFGFIEIGTVTPKAQPGNPKKTRFS